MDMPARHDIYLKNVFSLNNKNKSSHSITTFPSDKHWRWRT